MLVIIRGAGDLASGIALRLWHSGIQVVMTDLAAPLAIRRSVAFCEAIRSGEVTVEDLTARFAPTAEDACALLAQGFLPVLADPAGACLARLQPDCVVDAILAKRNLGTKITDAPIVIGIGPGFCAGKDCHAVIESMRGHTLGRAIYRGAALPNTNVPGLIGGLEQTVHDAGGQNRKRGRCDRLCGGQAHVLYHWRHTARPDRRWHARAGRAEMRRC